MCIRDRKTPVPRHVVAAQLRAASPASRARRASQIPEDVLRDLLREEGVSVDGDLVQAAVDAFGDDKADEDSFFDDRSDGPGNDGPGVAFARPASPDSEDNDRRPRDPRDDRSERAVYEPASDNERRPRDPRFVRPHESPASTSSDDSGILPGAAPARGGFVGALRGRTSQHNLGDLGPTHVAGAAPGVQDEVEFWLDGAARARTPRVPEPPPEGAWFWGDS